MVSVRAVDEEVEQEKDSLHVAATVRTAQGLDRASVDDLAVPLNRRLGQPVRLDAAVVPVIRAQRGE